MTAKKDDEVTLRDIMDLQMCIVKKVNAVKLEMERYKIKVVIISGLVALTVSLGVRLGLALWSKIIGL